MTCIIAHRDGWMISDLEHRFTDHTKVPCVKEKVLTGPGILWATCGQATLSDLAAEALRSATDETSAVAAIVDVFRKRPHEGEALILSKGGHIWMISSSGAFLPVQSAIWAIGSGYQAALGYLRGYLDASVDGQSVTPALAKQAIGYASQLNGDVSFDTHVLRL